MAGADDLTVSAMPTKDLFISMLTKDIPLDRAIIDLIDNAVDGARRLRDGRDFSGLDIRLTVGPDEFMIEDNCGGIPLDVARNYAFRFGRPEDMEATPHSVGQFGVGMKRALFKMGANAHILSQTDRENFELEIDVDRWRQSDRWEFRFSHAGANVPGESPPRDQPGTSIRVTRLYPEVSSAFAGPRFVNSLRQDIQAAHQPALESGLSIAVNGIPVGLRPLELLSSADLRPAFRTQTFFEESPPVVNVKLYAGLGKSAPRQAGWYIYCNGRMVLEADQTKITGWSQLDEVKIPRFHNQFARFRGFAFFDSDDAGRLPWNTTKTGLDTDSAVYQSVRADMVTMMRPVIDFLNRVADEADADEPVLEQLISRASLSPVTAIATPEEVFHFNADAPVVPRKTRISYTKDPEQVTELKQMHGFSTNKELGEASFDYFYEMEGPE